MTNYDPNWFDKDTFNKILAIIDSKTFGHRNKIVEFNYIDIKDLVNNIRNNTIRETFAKKRLNTLNEIKNAEITKYKRRSNGQKELLDLFNGLLDTILTDKTLKSGNQEGKNENINENVNQNENVNENDKALMSSKDENKNAKNKKTSTNTKEATTKKR